MSEKTLKFIDRANKKHNNKYSYPNTIYVKAIEKVKILCHIHGEFLQSPHEHLKGSGCKQCAINASKIKQTKPKEIFIEEANKKHDNKYTYCLDTYNNINDKIKITCVDHGIFYQRASSHLSGIGCPKCSYAKLTYTNEEFINIANKKHENKYDYSKTQYISSHKPITIICKTHGEFKQKAYIHLNGNGCKECANTNRIKNLAKNENSFSKSGYKSIARGRDCILYVIKCYNDNEEFFKIGITVNSVKKRYDSKNNMPYNYSILTEIIGDAENIWQTENNLKNNLKSKYTPSIKFNGSVRECYSDINEINLLIDKFSKSQI